MVPFQIFILAGIEERMAMHIMREKLGLNGR